jgi:hypothetical protein
MLIALQIVVAVLLVVAIVFTAVYFVDKGVKRYESTDSK